VRASKRAGGSLTNISLGHRGESLSRASRWRKPQLKPTTDRRRYLCQSDDRIALVVSPFHSSNTRLLCPDQIRELGLREAGPLPKRCDLSRDLETGQLSLMLLAVSNSLTCVSGRIGGPALRQR
jgi:hypothetical protein